MCYTKKIKDQSDKIINKLTKLSIKYKGDMKYVNDKLSKLKKQYPIYENFINY